jgi:hypothetical protein
VPDASLERTSLQADRGADLPAALGSVRASYRIIELREVVVASPTVTWRTTV